MAEYTCVVCPNSCLITVEDTPEGLKITGNQCERGVDFATREHTEPMRMFTSTVRTNDPAKRRLPVMTTGEIHKNKIGDCQEAVKGITVSLPVKCGDVILADICGEGVDLTATRSLS